MATPLLTVTQLAEYIERTIPPESPRAKRIVAMASNRVRGHAGKPEWSTDTPLPEGAVLAPDEAVDIAFDVAARAWESPKDGARQKQHTTGPYSMQATYAEVGIYLTDEEEATLDRLTGGGTSGVAGLWVLPTYREDVTDIGTVYADVVYPGGSGAPPEQMPWGTYDEIGS